MGEVWLGGGPRSGQLRRSRHSASHYVSYFISHSVSPPPSCDGHSRAHLLYLFSVQRGQWYGVHKGVWRRALPVARQLPQLRLCHRAPGRVALPRIPQSMRTACPTPLIPEVPARFRGKPVRVAHVSRSMVSNISYLLKGPTQLVKYVCRV